MDTILNIGILEIEKIVTILNIWNNAGKNEAFLKE